MTVVEHLRKIYPALVWGNLFVAFVSGRDMSRRPMPRFFEVWLGFVDEINTTPEGYLVRCRLRFGADFGGHGKCTLRAIDTRSSWWKRAAFVWAKHNVVEVCMTPWRHVRLRWDTWRPQVAETRKSV